MLKIKQKQKTTTLLLEAHLLLSGHCCANEVQRVFAKKHSIKVQTRKELFAIEKEEEFL